MDCGQEEKGTTEDEMAGWHHWLDGCESEWTSGVGDGQGGLACYNSWGHKESDMTERLIWSDLIWWLYWAHLDNLGYSPYFKWIYILHCTCNPNSPLSCNLRYSQVLERRMWAILEGHYSPWHKLYISNLCLYSLSVTSLEYDLSQFCSSVKQ